MIAASHDGRYFAKHAPKPQYYLYRIHKGGLRGFYNSWLSSHTHVSQWLEHWQLKLVTWVQFPMTYWPISLSPGYLVGSRGFSKDQL